MKKSVQDEAGNIILCFHSDTFACALKDGRGAAAAAHLDPLIVVARVDHLEAGII
jgi:hypothetical protein